MTRAAHMPGPWRWFHGRLVDANGTDLKVTLAPNFDPSRDAISEQAHRLIAAAPELLAFVEQVTGDCPCQRLPRVAWVSVNAMRCDSCRAGLALLAKIGGAS